ncbi:hypothetical protein GGD66_003981 [Bradyrhizobium sp. CIR48]|uniref:SMP-30/gluconolactonase/LRE family protein n=1 Tax=Bradyrhizobium sp. CIR48 TaxID=2663840 RepID=UPI0016058252|nr:SMP-30/gluconolactonase/LRE family protein [Bradyrhizobium sp. CIR48]MBB4425424.1 hypothetical protein [Bradyrhizobium sp. CIR48]
MSIFARTRRDLEQVLFPSRDRHAIPSMDGPLSPNEVLDAAAPIGPPLPGANDICAAPDGGLLVSAGRAIYRLSGASDAPHSVLHEFVGTVGAITPHPDGRLLVAVTGEGIWAIAPDGARRMLSAAAGIQLSGVTALAVAPDGTILAAQGSRQFAPADFLHDLMHKNRSGSIVTIAPDLNGARLLADELSFPAGLCLSDDRRDVLFTQAWTHSLHSLPLAGGAAKAIIPNLPGYPGRITRTVNGYLVCVFAMRTHLTELVLREDEFRNDMIAYIDPRYWIGPALSTTGSYYEPLQAGNVKKLGVTKPWAPPRSYGLVVEIDKIGEPLRSMHSRVGGNWHGITAAIETADGLVVVSQGAGQTLAASWENGQ